MQQEREYIICRRTPAGRTLWLSENTLTLKWAWKVGRGNARIVSASDLDATLIEHCANVTCNVLTYHAPAGN